jgi:hypothetical protein
MAANGGTVPAFFPFPGIVSPSPWRFVTLIDPGVTVGDAAAGGW